MSLNRRRFLVGSAAAAVVASTSSVPHVFASASRRAALAGGDRVLVVIQLSGGNDGLNTVIPYGDDAYHRGRFATRIAEQTVLKIDDYIGWHPSLRGFADMQQAGKLCIVQGAGYPNPNRSHFESMDIWHSGLLTPPHRTGWLGRQELPVDERAAIEAVGPHPEVAGQVGEGQRVRGGIAVGQVDELRHGVVNVPRLGGATCCRGAKPARTS